ncbi:hypothetical protein DNF23_58455, partial [Pseudomonas syringae pv. pisi]
EDDVSGALFSKAVPALSLAVGSHSECVWQALRRLHAVSPLWERACSRRRCIRRAVFEGCTGPFASKLAPTVSACGRRSADCMQ